MSGLRRMLAELDRTMPRRRLSAAGPQRPASFTCFSDPLDRYSFLYPSTWILRDGSSPRVSSPPLGLFARVDLLPPGGSAEARLAKRLPRLKLGAWRKGMPARATGVLPDGPRAFAWTTWLFELPKARIAFSTASVEDDAPASIQVYRRNILAAVRRSFRLSAGAR